MDNQDVGSDHCRVIPASPDAGLAEKVQFLRHEFAYRAAAQFLGSCEHLLEIGCGEGYGGEFLTPLAALAVQSDMSSDALRHVRLKYPEHVLCQLEIKHLPFQSATFDAVAAFQVIEHLVDPEAALAEVCRVLRPNGRLLLTTPNARFRLLPLQKPWNAYHVREYRHKALHKLVARFFGRVEIYGVIAPPEVMAMEKARVRQRPLMVYFLRPLSRLVSSGNLHRSLGSMVRAVRNVLWPRVPGQQLPQEAALAVKYSSFELSTTPGEGLDLYVVAGEPRQA